MVRSLSHTLKIPDVFKVDNETAITIIVIIASWMEKQCQNAIPLKSRGCWD